MKGLVIVLSGAIMMLSPALWMTASAEDAGGEKPKHDRKAPELTDMTVTGKITKEDVKGGKEGKTRSEYVLTQTDGAKVILGGRRMAEKDSKINLEDYVGKDVTVVGKGFAGKRDGNKRIVEITKIDLVAAAAPKV